MALPQVARPEVLAPHTLRLSGEEGCPLWRGRIHFAAAVAAVPAGGAMIARRPTVPVVIYALGLVALFAVSAGYHLLPLGPLARRRWRQADHSMIFVFTAASLTPFCLYAVGGAFGVSVAVAGWVGAAAGVAMKTRGFDRVQISGSYLYLGLGWLAAITFPWALARLDATQLLLLGGVGVFYTAGAAVLFTRRPDPLPAVFGYHEVWHGAVVAASVCYFAVLWGLVGR